MTALDACPCGTAEFTEIGSSFTARVCLNPECGRIAERCAEPGCDSFGDHIDDDGTEWCQWHCPGAECVADREVV